MYKKGVKEKMKTKLKNFNDLIKKYQDEADVYMMNEFEELVKAEAVKWVKDIRLKNSPYLSEPTGSYILRRFFNISEEDLKDEK